MDGYFMGAPGAFRGAARPMMGMRGAVSGFRRPFVPRGPMMMANPMAMMGGGFGMMPFGGMMMGGGFPGAFGGFGPMRGMGRGGMGRFSPYGNRGRVGVSSAVKVQPVPEGTSQEEVEGVFASYGTITLAVIKEGTPRFAYVNYSNAQEAAAAAAAGTVYLMGQPCQVLLSRGKKANVQEGGPTNGIGIFNIPFTMSQDELTSMVAAYPGFQTLKIVTNKMGMFRGYAFAYFDSVENASVAKQSLLGFQIGGQTLDCKYSNKSAEEALAAVA